MSLLVGGDVRTGVGTHTEPGPGSQAAAVRPGSLSHGLQVRLEELHQAGAVVRHGAAGRDLRHRLDLIDSLVLQLGVVLLQSIKTIIGGIKEIARPNKMS